MPLRAPLATTQIVLSEVAKSYDTRVVLDRVSCTVRPGERVGVVGDNGSGKSTLLRLLAGRERPDRGEVAVTAPGGLGYLAQTLDLPPTARVGEAVDLGRLFWILPVKPASSGAVHRKAEGRPSTGRT
ncbi:ATP-binding cassette domain-containing protein, partial [Streptomyces sp. NPDC001584]|uniref:ATP-binding cassette domain-containing protein n=1 Tax=Streptomyces sp. NPDC001584 TaxID=3154521 RepID=UPI00331F21EB